MREMVFSKPQHQFTIGLVGQRVLSGGGWLAVRLRVCRQAQEHAGQKDMSGTVAGQQSWVSRFGRVADSYAAQSSSDRNVGVVGLAIFSERGAVWTRGELNTRDTANPFPSRGYAVPPR